MRLVAYLTTTISIVAITGMHSLTHLLNRRDIQQQQLSFRRHRFINTRTDASENYTYPSVV